MEKKNLVVIGASAGGFDALRKLIAALPADLNAAIFIVWHMSPDVYGVLPQVLNRAKTIMAAHAVDMEPITFNRIYVAPPDRHLVVENGYVRVTRGPKENRFRPAVDPLFRSAAYIYGARVIGIILSGALDDGTAGLWTIKNRGGTAIVQNPGEAEVSSMPESALGEVNVDYCVKLEEMGPLLTVLCAENASSHKPIDNGENQKTEMEIKIAEQDKSIQDKIIQSGELTPYACPECHGVLSVIRDGELIRYRCHTGHAYSADSLLTSITENIEETLWSAIRGVEESILLLNNLGDHYAEKNNPKLAAVYFQKAKDAQLRATAVRQSVLQHEQLNNSELNREANEQPAA